MDRLTTISMITGLPILYAYAQSCGEDSCFCEKECNEYIDKNCEGCAIQEGVAKLYDYEVMESSGYYVKVVRCKNCKYYDGLKCIALERNMQEKGFCSFGELK